MATPAPSPKPELRPALRLRPIYGDTDQMGVVYYANYLRYFEAARSEYLRARGVPYREFEKTHGLFLPVVEANLRYHRPARYDDELEVALALALSGAATVRFDYEVRGAADAADVRVSGHTIHACVDRAGKPRRLPEAWRAATA